MYTSLGHVQTRRFIAVSEQILVPNASGKQKTTTYDDKLSYSVHLPVLHCNMRLFRRKPYQMPFADQRTKNVNGEPLR